MYSECDFIRDFDKLDPLSVIRGEYEELVYKSVTEGDVKSFGQCCDRLWLLSEKHYHRIYDGGVGTSSTTKSYRIGLFENVMNIWYNKAYYYKGRWRTIDSIVLMRKGIIHEFFSNQVVFYVFLALYIIGIIVTVSLGSYKPSLAYEVPASIFSLTFSMSSFYCLTKYNLYAIPLLYFVHFVLYAVVVALFYSDNPLESVNTIEKCAGFGASSFLFFPFIYYNEWRSERYKVGKRYGYNN